MSNNTMQDQARSTMNRSWLVQRLNKPHGGAGPLVNISEAFAFGGGLVNGGLSQDAMALLRPIFAFNYMGAAEFEFGAVPKALNGMAKDAGRLVAHTISVALAEVPQSWRDRSTTTPEGSATIYCLSRDTHRNEVEDRVTAWATGNSDLKESLYLHDVLRPCADGWNPDTIGWLELNNGFMFFVDRNAWQSTCNLFGVPAAEVTA